MTKNLVTKMDEPRQTLPADPMVSMIERIAMDPNSDLEKLEKMLEMKERLEERESRRAFDLAIAQAKAKIGPIIKGGEVDYVNTKGQRTHFKHETLDGIAKAIDPVLSVHGLSYRFRSKQEGGALHVTCVVAHQDGYSEETTLQGAPDSSGSKNAYQAVGSAATYLQRYTLKLALGLSAARDDDGQSAEGKGASVITEEQHAALSAKAAEAGVAEQKICLAHGVSDLADFPAKDFEAAMKRLERDLAAKKGGDNV